MSQLTFKGLFKSSTFVYALSSTHKLTLFSPPSTENLLTPCLHTMYNLMSECQFRELGES